MKLLVQPGDNTTALLEGIESAKKSIELTVFRADVKEIERALKEAVERGVTVHALIACRNQGGEEQLRKLEMRLLDYGVTVVRTGDDLARYHNKLMIIDRQQLFLMSFNLMRLDIERSRSFGVITANPQLVQEASRLFEADSTRQPFAAKSGNLVVSPINARKRLGDFILKTGKQLLIYDPKISDRPMMRVLHERAKAGVEIKVIGKVAGNGKGLEVRKLSHLRLHTRTMIRDGRAAFIGSQSLRKCELDGRREVGIILYDRRVVGRLLGIFQNDWMSAQPAKAAEKCNPGEVRDAARAAAQTLMDDFPPVVPALKNALEEIAGVKVNGNLARAEVRSQIQNAVNEAVSDAVEKVANDIVEELPAAGHK